jgi:predicted metal-binding membrane protein
MVVAMMLPKITTAVMHIYGSSLKRLRLILSVLFVLAYFTVWMFVSLGMIAFKMAGHLLMPASYLPAILIGVIALIWQFSPVKQRCLNRGHEHSVLSAFGWAAYRDTLRFGIMHGLWCVGAGWAIMLLPMLLPVGHTLAMIPVTLIMLSEHMEHPQYPQWRINFRGKLFRIILVQAQLKLKRMHWWLLVRFSAPRTIK